MSDPSSQQQQQQPLQQPVLAFPNSANTQPTSSHSNGSFGSVFIVLALIVVVSGIACCIGRFCNRKMQKPLKGGSKTKQKHNSQAPPKFHPQQSRRKDGDDLEYGFDGGHPPKGADLEFGFGGRPPKEGNLEFKFSGRPQKERDVEFGFDKRTPNGKPVAGHHGEVMRGGGGGYKVHHAANGEMKGEGHHQRPEFYG